MPRENLSGLAMSKHIIHRHPKFCVTTIHNRNKAAKIIIYNTEKKKTRDDLQMRFIDVLFFFVHVYLYRVVFVCIKYH